jgi:sugar lactone lactonase YvrE
MTASPLAATFRAHRVVAMVLLALAAAGCAGAKKKPDLVWPPPPDTARIKFIRGFTRAEDLSAGALTTAMRVLAPPPSDTAIAQPTGLALSPDDRFLYVSCAAVGRLLRVDLGAGKMELFAVGEKDRPQKPFSVATDAAGNVFVSDQGRNEIAAFQPDGKLLRRFGQDKLDKPAGIAIDRRRQVVYVVAGASGTSSRHRVEVFSLAGEHLRTIGGRGAAPGEFNFPTNLGVGSDGNVYVVDMLNFRVQIFDPEGQVVSMFGSIGAGQPGTFIKAKALAFDSFGNIYVVDSEGGYVQMFNAKYQSLMAFGGRYQAPGFMLVPNAIAITAKNTIFVADYAAGIVNEYQLINTTAEDSLMAPPEPKPASTPGAAPSASGQNSHGG